MTNELQLQTGPYRTTYIGTEIIRQSTKAEWTNYGEILKRVDEAKQWAIGDWLVDGKSHYGDGTYQEAERILGADYQYLARQKRIAELFKIRNRFLNLSWVHHYEVASIKTLEEKNGKLGYSSEHDMEKARKFLRLAEDDGLSVRELRGEVSEYKRMQAEQIRLFNEPDKYRVIYADPPWQYSDKLIAGYGAAEHHYPTMSIAELCAMPIGNIAAENAVLFLWVTSPLLEDAFRVINAWGFKYKTSFVWDKVKHNYGHYNSVRHEFLLVCTRGSCTPDATELFDSVQSIERTDKHSEKPEEFRQIIDTLYTDGSKIELFARMEVEGWKVWGNEV